MRVVERAGGGMKKVNFPSVLTYGPFALVWMSGRCGALRYGTIQYVVCVALSLSSVSLVTQILGSCGGWWCCW
jgi:hypothetical protein